MSELVLDLSALCCNNLSSSETQCIVSSSSRSLAATKKRNKHDNVDYLIYIYMIRYVLSALMHV